jgi:L-alanine-DL-glutamate epimerase-like enolase superfamily enzyme
MGNQLVIERAEIHQFQWEHENVGYHYNGFNLVYKPNSKVTRTDHALRIFTSQGIVGEMVGGGGGGTDYAQLTMWIEYLIGRNPLQRELIYNDVKRALRKQDRLSIGLVDIALWDIAGKLYNAPIWELLGGWRTTLPAHASTYHGDENGGLDSPAAFADFAVQCKQMGYKAFKIHSWGNAPIEREVANVLQVRKRVGDHMELMLDPACEYNTFAEALKVGRACDEANFFWYEDPFKDGGISCFAQHKLRQLIKTPILMGEHVRTLEPKVDAVVAGATNYMRVNPAYDLGITGTTKVAHAAEGFGIDVELQAPGPAQRHCMAAIRNTNYYELAIVHPKTVSSSGPIFADGYSDELDAIDSNGCVPVPDGPGLGVTYNWDLINSHRVGLQVYKH